MQHATEFVPIAYLLFDLKQMREEGVPTLKAPNLSSIPVAWTEGFSLEVDAFFKRFQEVASSDFQKTLNLPTLSEPQVDEKFKEGGNGILSMIPGGTLLSTASTEKYMHNLLEETSLRFLKINMIWMFISLYETGMFGPDLFSFPMPEAIALFSAEDPVGMGLKAKEALFARPLFPDGAYYKENAPSNENSLLGTSLAVVADAKKGHAYLGNTAAFEIGDPGSLKKGYLTLAMDADRLLQKMVLALHRAVFLVYEGKIVTAFTEEGGKIHLSGELQLPLEKMLGEKYGLVNWDKESYFFLHMMPFPSIDLHFFVFNPEKVEFALLHDLEEGSEKVVSSILFGLHVTGIVALLVTILILNNIAKRITDPIRALADATKEVAKGHYDQVKLPPVKHQDEIAVLCHSFEEMVQGLLEKEKVKGVLNKVVSPEIAQEI